MIGINQKGHKMQNSNFSIIALVKEIESPENPGALEKRVALIPKDVARLTKAGIEVFVEYGAGEGVDFSDDEYLASGAIMQSDKDIYQDKQLIIKFKGPSLASIEQMQKGSTLFCMAHFHSYPERAKLLQDNQINVIAMEEIYESPKVNTDENILSRVAMNEALKPFFANNSMGCLRVSVFSWSSRLRQAINRCSNRSPRSLRVIQPNLKFEELDVIGNDVLYFYDSKNFSDEHGIIEKLKNSGTHIFDLYEFEQKQGKQAIANYRTNHPPAKFGLRRIQCLHETGQAGAAYGLKLLAQNKPDLNIENAKVVILGYGNVGQGAIDKIYQAGVKNIHVLGRAHTAKGRIDFWLKDADLVINGAEQSAHLRSKNFLISNAHLKDLIPNGSVVIDLVGGSESNRSPVEAVINCSFLTDPHFVQSGVTISALWGWPMMGMMKETAIRYSGQIVEILIGHERLIDGLGLLKPNVEQALVCSVFEYQG